MFVSLRKKIYSIFKINDKYKYECIKVCLIYSFIGFFWIYFSDKIVHKGISNRDMLLIINIYKGLLHVIVSSITIYLLINTLLKKIDLTENKLNESHKELSLVNEELEARVQQLTAFQQELTIQYDQITKSEKKLSKSEEKNRAIIKAMPDLLFIINNDGYFIDCMASDESLLLMPKEDFIGKAIWEVIPDEISEVAYEKMQSVIKYGILEKFEYKLKISDKDQCFELRMVKNNEKEILAISRNITVERQNELELKISEEKYKALVNEMQQGLAVYEGDSEEEEVGNYRFVDSNKSYEKITGLKSKDILGKTICEIFPNIKKSVIEKYKHVMKTGEPICYESYLQDMDRYYELIVYTTKKLQLAVIVTDISDRKQMELKLEYLSYHDQLTGLYNRRFFEQELRRLDKEENLPLTIIMADVNGLKLVNDSLGHVVGDELLKKVAKAIIKGCRVNDIIARLGGDEFVILLPNTGSYETEQILKRIKSIALKEMVGAVEISISFGYETKKSVNVKIAEVLKKSEDFMYKKKLFDSPSMRGKTISAIISTLHEKNKREEQHSHRVSALCQDMGKVLGLHEDEIKELKTVGLLHDIGKIAIEENVLNKPGKLTDEEWEQIKRHPEIGYRILSTVNDMSEMAEYILAHHERWDGKGYPKGLSGEEIPLQSRIITIADSYDAMISERSYRNALPEEVAIKELKLNAGIQFDPELIRIFIEKVLDRPCG